MTGTTGIPTGRTAARLAAAKRAETVMSPDSLEAAMIAIQNRARRDRDARAIGRETVTRAVRAAIMTGITEANASLGPLDRLKLFAMTTIAHPLRNGPAAGVARIVGTTT